MKNIFNTKLRPNIELNGNLDCFNTGAVNFFKKQKPITGIPLYKALREVIQGGDKELTPQNLNILKSNIDYLNRSYKLGSVHAAVLMDLVSKILKK